MKKIKDCIAKNWKDYMTIILMSFSVVCILLDIKKICNISDFYSPYILIAPISLIILLKIFFKEEVWTKELYYVSAIAAMEYLILLLLNKTLFTLNFKITIYVITLAFS